MPEPDHPTLEQQAANALDQVLTSLRIHLERTLSGLTHELVQAALEDQARAATEAATAAAAEVHRLAESQLAQIRDAAQRQVGDLRGAAEEQLNELRLALQQQADSARRISDDRLVELERAADARMVAAERREVARMARLADAIRTLDRASTLGHVLDALSRCAGREVPRAAVLIVRGDRVRGWHFSNFGPREAGHDGEGPAEAGPCERQRGPGDAGPDQDERGPAEAGPYEDDPAKAGYHATGQDARSLMLTVDAAGMLAAVARTGRPVAGLFTPAGGPDGAILPAFARGNTSRHALAYPITVAGQVVAVLYGDSPASEVTSTSARWPAILEVLGRHASCVLEAMTVRQAASLGTPRAPAPSSTR